MPWLVVFAAGVALVLLARIISFFSDFDAISDEDKASALFSLLGNAGLVVGLTLASFFQQSVSWGARAAFAIAAAYFLIFGTAINLR